MNDAVGMLVRSPVAVPEIFMKVETERESMDRSSSIKFNKSSQVIISNQK